MTAAVVVQTSRPRGGRRFEPIAERALIEPAREAARRLPGAYRGVVVIEELVGPQGIPDLTVIVGPPEPLRRRLLSPVPALLNEIDAGIVSVAHHCASRTPATLAQRLGWPLETVQRRIGKLIRCGALIETAAGRFVSASCLQPLGRIYAVEAKVRDGGAALRQVRAYTTWADAYVIVTGPLGSTATSRLRSAVAAENGGLVVDGRWQCRPSLRPASRARRLWSAEHVVAALRPAGTGEITGLASHGGLNSQLL